MPGPSCLSALFVVFGSFAIATDFCTSDTICIAASPPLVSRICPIGGGSGLAGPPNPIPGGGPPPRPPGCGALPSTMRTKFAVASGALTKSSVVMICRTLSPDPTVSVAYSPSAR